MNFSLIFDVLPLLANGMAMTVALTLGSVVVGALIALPLAMMRASSLLTLSHLILLYTFLFRGTPLLVQLFLLYYGASQVDWVRSGMAWHVLREPIWCALIVFALNHAAYTTEILRGGIRAVPAGEIEAAKALGMSYACRMRRLVLPSAIRLALPAYGNEVIMMLKASSLASTITIMELTGTARKIVAQTFSPYEVFIAAAMIYLALTILITHVFQALELRGDKHRPRPVFSPVWASQPSMETAAARVEGK